MDHITELAALSLADGATYQSVVALPRGVSISAEVEGITGINDALCAAEGRPIEAVLRSFADFVRRQVEAAGPGAYPLLIAHNLKGAWRACACRGGAGPAAAGRELRLAAQARSPSSTAPAPCPPLLTRRSLRARRSV